MTERLPQPGRPSEADRELLSSYLDHQLTAAERTALEARLAQEPALQSELDELRATTALLQNLAPVVPPRSFSLDLRQMPARRTLWSGWMRFGGAVAVLLLALTTGAVFAVSQLGFGGGADSVARMEEAADLSADLSGDDSASPSSGFNQAETRRAPTPASPAGGAGLPEAAPAEPEAPAESEAGSAPASEAEAPATFEMPTEAVAEGALPAASPPPAAATVLPDAPAVAGADQPALSPGPATAFVQPTAPAGMAPAAGPAPVAWPVALLVVVVALLLALLVWRFGWRRRPR